MIRNAALTAGIVVGAMIGAAVVTATPARADDIDFVIALADAGVYYKNMSDVMDTGKLVCRNLRSGGNGASAVSGFPSADVGIIVSAARSNMCPDV